jgi:leucyl-tRNA synthetase
MKKKLIIGCLLINILVVLNMQYLHFFIHVFLLKVLNKCNKKIKISEPFKNLFTQGMVCHESYKDEKGNWLYPEEIEKIDNKKLL